MGEVQALHGAGSGSSLVDEHRQRFHARFGNEPGVRLFFAPGRVNLMGAHLDYNGGPVMPMAIDRGTILALRPRTDRRLHLASTLEEGEFAADLDALPKRAQGAWSDYPLGVLADVLPEAGDRAPGLDVLFGGDLAIGAGLSSSASICVGTAFALSRLWDLDLSIQRCIEAALWGEREFVGVQCGIMDPYAVGYGRPGHVLWLDCKDASTGLVPLGDDVSIAVADTGLRRELAQGEFNARVAECAEAFARLRPAVPEATCLRDVPAEVVEAHRDLLGPKVLSRARHVVREVHRTFTARQALLQGDVAAFGRAISEAHASLRDLFEVSVPELDLLVEASLEWDGVLGTRLTGAGFGGCTVVLLRTAARPGFAEHVQARFQERFGRKPTLAFYGGGSGPCELEA